MMRFIIAVAIVVAVCQVDSQTYILPDGSDTLISNLKTTFSCDNRPYGYYADVDNDCKVFHVCQPIDGEDGQVIKVLQFSFFCGNLTIFNQETLTCGYPEESLSCADAASAYDITNANFGVIPTALVEDTKSAKP